MAWHENVGSPWYQTKENAFNSPDEKNTGPIQILLFHGDFTNGFIVAVVTPLSIHPHVDRTQKKMVFGLVGRYSSPGNYITAGLAED